MSNVYINYMSVFLPNQPVSNDEIDDYIGAIGGDVAKVKKIVLGRNRIKQRYYALNKKGEITHTNVEMAAEAVNKLFQQGVDPNNVQMLTCATDLPDQLIPSHASMVHGHLKLPPLEIVSIAGVCLTSMQALKTLFNAIKLGEKNNGICTGSEFISPTFKADNYTRGMEYRKALEKNRYMEFEREFLRYMLSDGAAAVFLEDKPREDGLSLRIEWIENKSYANCTSTVMYVGAQLRPDGELKGWKEFSGEELLDNAIFAFCQDFKTLMSGMKYWVDFIEEVIAKHNIDTATIDYVLPHVSSMFIGEELQKELQKRKVCLYDNWFINLTEIGNIGSASIFAVLEELTRTKNLQKGNKILLLVPESARFSYGMALLTVV